jgi:hypothetical protein
MPLVFHIGALPKWARNPHTPIRGAEARWTPVLRGIPIFPEIADSQFRLKFRCGYADIRSVKPVPAKEKVSAAFGCQNTFLIPWGNCGKIGEVAPVRMIK